MSAVSVKDIANIRFGGFYIPVVSWLFIYTETGNRDFLPVLGIVLVGATIWHGIYRSIFGYEGPEVHPKKRVIVAGYFLALLLVENPGRNPDTVDELLERIKGVLSIRRAVRFSLMFSVSIFYIIATLYSLKPLYGLAISSNSLPAGILLLAQIVFLLQGIIFNRFASVVPPGAAEWVWVPEFRRIQEEFGESEEYDSPFKDPPLILDDIHEQIADLKETLEPLEAEGIDKTKTENRE